MLDLTDRLKTEAFRLGFDQVGIAPAVASPDHARYREWLEAGHAAGMDYLHRQAEARAHPRSLLEGVRSVVMVSLVYGRPTTPSHDPHRGRIARYAQGADYHDVLWRRLEALLSWLQVERPGTRGRCVADSAPLLERDFARRAGLGWVGKNTMLIDRRLGSFTVLGALLTDADLRSDPPHHSAHCGTCTRCLDACPTTAFPAPYQLDARRCISYWTIEHKGPFPDEAAESLHGWVFGCDLCQEVCPWNRKAPPGREPSLQPVAGRIEADLVGWLEAEPAAFTRSLKGTALSRPRRRGLLRNAAVLLGQRRVADAVPALIRRIRTDAEPLVRAASAWALGRIGGGTAQAALIQAKVDPDALVREASVQGLSRC